jgi:hypothetical protein
MKNLILILALITSLNSFSQKGPYANPAMIYGSDFGNMFKLFYAQGNFDYMLKFTSSESIKKHGKAKVLEFYKNKFKFGYALGSLKSTFKEGNVTILNYPDAKVFATKKVVRIPIVIENDSCKIVLSDNLNDFLK